MIDFFEKDDTIEVQAGSSWPIMLPAKVLQPGMTPVHITIVVMIYSFNGQEIDWEAIADRCEKTLEEVEEMTAQMHEWGIFWK